MDHCDRKRLGSKSLFHYQLWGGVILPQEGTTTHSKEQSALPKGSNHAPPQPEASFFSAHFHESPQALSAEPEKHLLGTDKAAVVLE